MEHIGTNKIKKMSGMKICRENQNTLLISNNILFFPKIVPFVR